jgi:hypothetical protein
VDPVANDVAKGVTLRVEPRIRPKTTLSSASSIQTILLLSWSDGNWWIPAIEQATTNPTVMSAFTPHGNFQ